uniref:SecY-independent transporter protein n=1 Tax=Kryptoperidinium foliaceum endosymbiont TaxID=1079369 RepID=I6N5R8_9STRA|nr:SecY-independent transporter protein [Kryptoperidinium foliaceum endosymbiont]
MNFDYYKYYKEIKNRLVLVFFAWVFCFNTCYYYKETILFLLVNTNNTFLNLNNQPYFIFTDVTEVFYVYFELVIFCSNQIALSALFYQTLMFLSLGLYQFEFTKLKLAFQLFILTWLLSSTLLFKVVIPFSWKFFLSFQETSVDSQVLSFFFEAKLNEYLEYLIRLYYVCLISCQFLVILIVSLINLSEKLKKTKMFRKLFYLIFVVFSTIITPPDVLSQILISSILIVVYEFLTFLKKIKISMVTS